MVLLHPDTVVQMFERLQVWTRYDQRAPHKPLLALWAIGRCLKGQPRLVSFNTVNDGVGELIRRFGPPRSHIHPDYPFWRLRNDSLWEVVGAANVRETGSGDAYKRDLLKLGVKGGFPESIYRALRQDKSLCSRIAQSLVQAHSPVTQHEDVLEDVRISTVLVHLPVINNQQVRDPKFRRIVLEAYNSECALCGFSVRLDEALIAIDAAHIKWHQAHGPAEVKNGMALCALHHRLFDAGAFTIRPDLTVIVADSVSRSGSREWLWRFADRPVSAVLSRENRPSPEFIEWYEKNVFKGQVTPIAH